MKCATLITSLYVIALCAGVCAQSTRKVGDGKGLPQAGEAKPTKPKRIRFPTLEPFMKSRMWAFSGAGIMLISPKKGVDVLRKWKEESARHEEERSTPGKPKVADAVSAMLPEPKSLRLKVLYSQCPALLGSLRRLWLKKKWNEAELEFAIEVGNYLQELPRFPRLAFVAGNHNANHVHLARLVAWFESEIKRPEIYGQMIFTMDDGPYGGLPVKKLDDKLWKVRATKSLADGLSVEILEDEGAKEPVILRGRRGKEILWAVRISGEPRGQVRQIKFAKKRAPTKLGNYGWKLHFFSSWSFGEEYTHVYLSPKGALLFYFLSW